MDINKINPATLKITDMRFADIDGAPKRCTLLKLYTNQGLVGYGEVRDASSRTYAAMLKSRILGENPCNVEKIFRRIKQFGGDSRQAGGVCAVELACWDLCGKAWGVPVWQLLGGKWRDEIRCYCDTDSEGGGRDMGQALVERMKMGFTFLKMDLGIELLANVKDALIAPLGYLEYMRKMKHVVQTPHGSIDPRSMRGEAFELFTTGLTNAYGEEVVKGKQQLGEEIGYTYVKDSVLGLSFITPPGWPYYDGTTLKTDIYVNNIDNNVYTPFGGYGIPPIDYGPVNGWCVEAANADGEVEFVGRFASTADALAALKHNYGMIPYYSDFEHSVTVSGDGKSITIDEVTTPAKERYHYLDAEGVPMLLIDDGEADITSVREDETDAALMSIGSVLSTFSGFDYSVIYADDVGFTEGLGETEPVKGNGGKLELKAPKGDAGKRFYRIRITD